jgi:hypothetical protein
MPPAGPKPSGSGSPVKILLIVAAVLVVGGGAFLVLSGGGDEASADTPDGAVEAFFDAAGSGDCEALQELVVQNEDADELAASCQSAGESGEGIPEMTLHDASVVDQGDSSATVSVEYTMETFGAAAAPGQDPTTSVGNERTTEEWTLQLQDGTWRVDIGAIGSGSSSSGGSPGSEGSSGGEDSSGGGSSGEGSTEPALCSYPTEELADLPPEVYEAYLVACT